jgi:hypothetical protein
MFRQPAPSFVRRAPNTRFAFYLAVLLAVFSVHAGAQDKTLPPVKRAQIENVLANMDQLDANAPAESLLNITLDLPDKN